MKKKVWIIIASGAAAVVMAVLAAVCFLLPYLNAKSEIPQDTAVTVYEQEDGTWSMTYPKATQATYYLIEVFEPVEETEEDALPEMVYTAKEEGTSCSLPALPDDRELTLRITPAVEYGVFTETETRYGENCIEVTTVFAVPRISNLVSVPDSDSKSVAVTFEMREGDVCVITSRVNDGMEMQLRDIDKGETVIAFGENGDMLLPAYEDTYNFIFTAQRCEEGIELYGLPSGSFALVREDLLGRDLALAVSDEGENVFSFTWQETKGEHYEVQVTNEYTEGWVTVDEIPRDGERTYTTPHLVPFETYEYRVLAVGGQTIEGKETAAESEEISVTTKESAVFSTVWPVNNLDVYSDTEKTEVIGTATVGTAFWVLEEKDGMFRIRTDAGEGYIDSNYCMINLPDYMGSLCYYNITNSYSSIYMVHEYMIPNVTGVVTAGYGDIRQTDGSFLVPLLYPTAQKLLNAAQTAVEQGYKLKIYDAFRPYVATREIYDITARYMDDPIPERTYTGRWVDLSALDLPEPEDDETEPEITYELLMTNNKYSLSSFLARSGSTHNRGIALDLTLVDMETGKEVAMQTSIHDLSWYSVLYRNNKAANVLADIMKGAGFNDLVSEWWHFQDNESRDALDAPSVTYGVNAECWVKDDYGWRYRNADGDYYTDVTIYIVETEYTFDENGYVTD